MRKIFSLTLILFTSAVTGWCQPVPDPARLAKMSPAELEAYRQQMLKAASTKAKQLAAQYDFKLDETTMPDDEGHAPVKDLKRLAVIPAATPSMAELTARVRKAERQLQSLAPPPLVQEVKTMTEKQDGPTLQASAIGQWINNNPVQALLLQMAATLRSGNNHSAWNNLAAFYNMTGMEHQSVPILQRLLQEEPGNPMLLNNLGQAWLGLGDMGKATDCLLQCLAEDELNPEANHSLGMMAAFAGKVDEAMKYFEKELQVAVRRSTLARIKKMGRSVNLAAIRRKRRDIPHRDLFTEIGLDRFRIPALPQSSDATADWRTKSRALGQSIATELQFWLQAGEMTDEDRRADGRRPPGLYSDLADLLLSEHGDEYAPLLGVIGKQEVAALEGITSEYWKKMGESICPTPPPDPGGGGRLTLAYAKKCCDQHKPIVDAYMREWNSYVEPRLDQAVVNWKSYINGWVDIAQLDPSNAMKKAVYKTVADYFTFLATALQTQVAAEPPPAECMVNLTTEEADAIIAASHDIDLRCPEWLKLKIGLGAFTLQADCNQYSIDGGEGLLIAYEKNFRTGACTISAGVGEKADFKELIEADMSMMAYISLDNNNQVSDFGIKGSASAATKIGGLEGGYSLGVNSGFNAAVNGKGILKNFINLSLQQ